MSAEIAEKEEKLSRILRGAGSMLVAYSGGVDSTLLLALAARELGSRALGVLAASPSRSPEESAQAHEVAEALGLEIRDLNTEEFSDPQYSANTPERCYFCKRILFSRLAELARQEGFAVLAEGSQLDDAGDARPGRRAVRELQVRSPLAEAAFRKADTRALAQALGLPNWDRPAAPCLATRAAFGIRLTPELMFRIAEAERRIKTLMPELRDLRVRHLGEEARIEVDPERVGDAEKLINSLSRSVAGLGYRRVTLAPEGYRSGSLAAGAGIN